jgi:hypothetical protein
MWTQRCDDGVEFSGVFELTQGSDGGVSGTATGSDGIGSISGKLIGRKLTGTRHYVLGHNNAITFTLSGSNLDAPKSRKTTELVNTMPSDRKREQFATLFTPRAISH